MGCFFAKPNISKENQIFYLNENEKENENKNPKQLIHLEHHTNKNKIIKTYSIKKSYSLIFDVLKSKKTDTPIDLESN